MSDSDDQIARLFRASRPKREELADTPPWGLATRVLAAAARHQPPQEDDTMLRVCRLAVWWSGALAALAIYFSAIDHRSSGGVAEWRTADVRSARALAQQVSP